MGVQRQSTASGTWALPGFNPNVPYPVIDPLGGPVNGVRFDPGLVTANMQRDYYENVDEAAFKCLYAPWACSPDEDDPDVPNPRPPNRNVDVQNSNDTMKALIIGAFVIGGIVVIRGAL